MSRPDCLTSAEKLAEALVEAVSAESSPDGYSQAYLEQVQILLTATGLMLAKANGGTARENQRLYVKSLRRHAMAIEHGTGRR